MQALWLNSILDRRLYFIGAKGIYIFLKITGLKFGYEISWISQQIYRKDEIIKIKNLDGLLCGELLNRDVK